MELQSLKVLPRKADGSSVARQTRRAGLVPAVLYGGEKGAVSISVNSRSFDSLIQHSRGGEHAIVRLEFEGASDLDTPALLKAVQHDPLRGTITHADFLRISLDKRIETVVTIRLVGQAPGIAEGGVLDHQLRDLEVECLALDVPEEIVLDVSALHLNDTIHVSQVVVPENVTILSDPERQVVAIHPPRVLKDTGAEGEGDQTSPEVITEKKDKGEDSEKKK